MIVLKTGVPRSGKSLSMVYELLQKHRAECKGAEMRPVYTNITDLNLPHFPLRNWEPDTKREEGVLYTIDWRKCPAGSIVIIDEAFLYGYDARSQQSNVPDYLRDLAVHGKDYSLDIYFICQHPKLLHVAVRRQVGKHQHYRRVMGMQRAVVYEWDQCQDNLSATKTAVMSQFAYPREAYACYKSADIHLKQKFKLPLVAFLPLALLPLAAWALPNAYTALHGSMTGKGVTAPVVVQDKPASNPLGIPIPAGAPAGFVPVGVGQPLQPQTVAPQLPAVAPVMAAAGCIVTPKGCGCFDIRGSKVEKDETMCEALEKRSPPVEFASSFDQTYYRPKVDVQTVAAVFGVNKVPNTKP